MNTDARDARDALEVAIRALYRIEDFGDAAEKRDARNLRSKLENSTTWLEETFGL